MAYLGELTDILGTYLSVSHLGRLYLLGLQKKSNQEETGD